MSPDPASPGGGAAVSRVRVGVGLLLGIVTVLVILLDGLLGRSPAFRSAAPGTGLLVALLSAAALRELYALLGRAGIPSIPAWGASASFAILALRAVLPAAGVRPSDAEAFGHAALGLAAILPAAGCIGFRAPEGAVGPSAEALRPFAGTALGLLLVHLPMAMLLELRLAPALPGMTPSVPSGLVLAAMVAVGCKVGDSAAYFAGRTVGRRPLCWVSPKKTWEGAVAGAAAGTAAAAFLGVLFGLPLAQGLAFGFTVNLAGQGGDLLESWVKRCCGAKDSGDTFGEMGGALDLVDALLLAGPAGYLFHRVVLA